MKCKEETNELTVSECCQNAKSYKLKTDLACIGVSEFVNELTHGCACSLKQELLNLYSY